MGANLNDITRLIAAVNVLEEVNDAFNYNCNNVIYISPHIMGIYWFISELQATNRHIFDNWICRVLLITAQEERLFLVSVIDHM